ncbi:hypothetical protein D3C83_168180 [compost metagenome]
MEFDGTSIELIFESFDSFLGSAKIDTAFEGVFHRTVVQPLKQARTPDSVRSTFSSLAGL